MTKPKWTIMVYLAGDNDLPAFCISVLQQLEAVKYPDDVCVLACFDSSVPWSEGSRYFRINCGHGEIGTKVDWDIHNDLVVGSRRKKAIAEAPFGNPDGQATREFYRPVVSEGLRRFVNWSVDKHSESERYMLVLFGHGLAVGGQNFLITENPPSFLQVGQLKEILGKHFGGERKLDVLALQNCVMNGIEMAVALKDQVNLMVGSQDLVLSTGWPYEKLMTAVVEDLSLPSATVAEKVLKVCARNMLDFAIMDRSSEQSVFDLRPLRDPDGFRKDMRELADTLIAALHYDLEDKKRRVLRHPAICDATRLARLEAQAYWKENYVDLFDFCERLIKKCNEIVKTQSKLLKDLGLEADPQPKLRESSLVQTARDIIRCCRRILEREKELIPLSYYIGPELQYSRGVSIYFPWSLPGAPYFPVAMPGGRKFQLRTTFDIYHEYEFVEETNWAKFLEAFFLATLRNMRRADRTFIDIEANASLERGLIDERFGEQAEFRSGDLARSSPDTGRADYDKSSSNVKNYPRRNYLSPVDWEHKVDDDCSVEAKTETFPEPTSPPPSALGWNIAGLVASVIEKKPSNARKNGKPKAIASNQNGTHKGVEDRINGTPRSVDDKIDVTPKGITDNESLTITVPPQ